MPVAYRTLRASGECDVHAGGFGEAVKGLKGKFLVAGLFREGHYSGRGTAGLG